MSQWVTVAEIDGEYGPVRVSELLIQKVWLRQDFCTDALRTLEGDAVRVLAPGRWNRLEGPDFREARLEIGGEIVEGDVEIHFYRRDWYGHGHDRDAAYGDVRLHAVVFPPLPHERPPRTRGGRTLPTLILLPLLRRDLEAVAMEEALRGEGGEDPLDIAARLLERPLHERLALVRGRAAGRWERKVRHAARRIAEQGWDGALHTGCMEVLGYHRNRAPMRAIAQDWPLERLAKEQPEAEQLFEATRTLWKLNGLRPANQPLPRLRQYLRLAAESPRWPAALANDFLLPEREFSASSPTADARKGLRLKEREKWLAQDVLHGAVGGTRLHTLACDLVLPMLSARLQAGAGHSFDSRADTPEGMVAEQAPDGAEPGGQVAADPLFPLWYHWPVGDVPDGVAHIARVAEITDRTRPACNGLAQGVLQLCLEGIEALTSRGIEMEAGGEPLTLG